MLLFCSLFCFLFFFFFFKCNMMWHSRCPPTCQRNNFLFNQLDMSANSVQELIVGNKLTQQQNIRDQIDTI